MVCMKRILTLGEANSGHVVRRSANSYQSLSSVWCVERRSRERSTSWVRSREMGFIAIFNGFGVVRVILGVKRQVSGQQPASASDLYLAANLAVGYAAR